MLLASERRERDSIRGKMRGKMRARGTFFSKKHVFLGLTPVYSETTAISKPYFILKLQSVRKFMLKGLFSRNKKLIRPVTMALKTLFQTEFQHFPF